MENTDINEAVQELETILDVVRWSVSRFNQAGLYFGHGTDNAWDEVISMVLQVLHLPQQIDLQLYQSRLTTSEKRQVLELIQRRIDERVPAAYLTNQAWFCGLPFYVDERVLVPRSPIAELIQNRFAGFLTEEPGYILDLCTGSACIAIACAYEFPEAQVDAADISYDALDVASINIEEHQLQDRVFPLHSDVYSGLAGQKYDLIVTNPPYVDAEDIADMPEEFHVEPVIGLAAGEDGLDIVHTILRDAPDHLNDGGWLIVEVGNSLVHMNEQYADLPLTWITFEHGGDGVFAVQKEALAEYFAGNE
ncbi:50S ribosomal protein L3 N(5)-glutamine methyltransferase [Paraneptunicella aestuarii]|uniref:50S ribosomal protein L3 N(5)-glutamine methyltransferase n=1 Tax=Paraneptunicella aestuarii TaxID=2831148 RepID=UPI001E404705|nr:50S ribosomal protein L3 N(5)-glutamine methyltransferase [Paraneptunicella aestuarii]UAA37522.1 50S ribosomal protein L3 N(5)-glutamine methyltransferase [Paraneptunicella aestuarii]